MDVVTAFTEPATVVWKVVTEGVTAPEEETERVTLEDLLVILLEDEEDVLKNDCDVEDKEDTLAFPALLEDKEYVSMLECNVETEADVVLIELDIVDVMLLKELVT